MGDRERVDACLDEIARLSASLARANSQLELLTRSPFVRMVLAEASADDSAFYIGKSNP